MPAAVERVAAARGLRVRVAHRRDHALHLRIVQGVRARRRAAVVVAGLEVDVDRRALRAVTRALRAQRPRRAAPPARSCQPSPTMLSSARDDAADARIRRGGVEALLGEFERAPHHRVVERGEHGHLRRFFVFAAFTSCTASRKSSGRLEAAVDRGEADVGDLVELGELAHHEVADAAGRHLALAERAQALDHPVDRALDLLGRHRALAQREHHAAHQLVAVEVGAAAVLLHQARHLEVDALVGGEALLAGDALAPPADGVRLEVGAGVDHLGVVRPAERAFHAYTGKRCAERLHLARDARKVPLVRSGRSSTSAMRCASFSASRLAEAARGHRRRADADAAGDRRLLRIVRDRVLVDRDVRAAERRLRRPCR